MLIDSIKMLIKDTPDTKVAVAFHDGATGNELLIRATESFHPASTIKIAVMMEVFNQANQGFLSLDERIPIVNEFVSIADGSLFSVNAEDDSELTLYQRIGQTESLRELIRLMITVSSNFATNLLIQRVTAPRVMDLIHSLGIHDILVLRGPEDNLAFARGLNNKASADGLMRLLQALVEGRVVSSAASQEMIQIMLGQKFNEGIPAGLPPDLPVAHKTGWNLRSYHDAAIVFPPGRDAYILVVMTDGFSEDVAAHELVAAISAQVYGAITEKNTAVHPHATQ